MSEHPAQPLIDADEVRLARARLAAFARDGLGHTLDDYLEWSAARRNDPSAPCPPPSRLR